MTTGAIAEIPTSEYAPRFIGGRALGAKIYWDEVPPDIDAFDPRNRLIFVTGPTVGTLAPSANRVAVTAKSPVPYPVECYCHSSIGGHWGPQLKFAGYDGVVVQGRAAEPVYIEICDADVEIFDATHLWGMTARDAQIEVQKRRGSQSRVLVIGPAGETLCREAIITVDTAAASGQGGYGAVMGSKNLKAIAVRGTGSVKVAKPQVLMDVYSHFARLATCKPGEGQQNPVRYMKYYTGVAPGERRIIDDVDDSAIGEEVAKGHVEKRVGGCYACPVGCLIGLRFKDESVPGGAGSCNEYHFCRDVEHAYYGGKKIGKALVEATRLHDDLGLSETQTGLKWEYEWFWELVKAGILTEENTELPIDQLGSSEFWRAYLPKIAYREGIGDLLAEGEERFFAGLLELVPDELREKTKAIGDWWLWKSGCGYYAHLSGHEGITNALSLVEYAAEVRRNLQTRGHLTNPNSKACYLSPEEVETVQRAGAIKYFGSPTVLNPHSFDGKVPAAIYLQHLSLVSDSVPYCRWAFPKAYSWYTPDHLGDVTIGSKIFSAVTGIDVAEDELLRIVGERGWNLERAILVREGRRREHDGYNDSVFERNRTWLSKDAFTTAMDDYYTARGWDRETGVPRRRTLEALGLHDVADGLEEVWGVTVPP